MLVKKLILFWLILFSIILMLAQADNLFISEYIEGSSNNKAIEIFNGTGETVNLAEYSVKRANNGGDWGFEEALFDELADGEVFVIANDQAVPDILDIADHTSQLTWFNGNDVIALFHNETLIDIIGIYQEDPGTAWPVAGIDDATKEHTLVRKSFVDEGNPDWLESSGTNADDSEWLVYDQNTFEFLGDHQMGDIETPSIVGSFNDWNPADPDFALFENEFGVFEHTHVLGIGNWEYKAIEGDTWDASNYPVNNQVIDLDSETEITWKVNIEADLVTHTNPVIAGNFISELGGNDWDPTDLTGEMIDYDGESIFEWEGIIPEGTWEFKVSLNNNWDQSTGPNVIFISDGVEETFITYDFANNETVASGPEPDKAEITFTVNDSYGQSHPAFYIKGSWDPSTGSYDPGWGNGAETQLYDDGTNGDQVADDHTFSVMVELVVDGGSNTWEWGVLDENHNWIDGNWEFQIFDMTAQTHTYTMEIPELSILEIQGETDSSPYVNYVVETWGIVIANNSNGFFLQDEPTPWSGVFVYSPEHIFTIGDEISLIALVEEYNDLTELKNINEFEILSSENPLPVAINISTVEANEEAYEGVLVKVQNAECTEVDLGFGEWEVDDNSGSCRIDDMFVPYVPEEGELYSVTGPLNYSFGTYKIEPRDENDIIIGGMEDYGFLACNVENETGEPLENVQVGIDGDIYLTDDEGYVEIMLPEGFYSVTFSLEGYESYSLDNVEIIVDETTELEIILIEINIELNPPRELTATVTDDDIELNWLPPIMGNGDEIEEGFDTENLPDGWTAIDNDGDGYNWEVSADWGGNNDSAHCMTSASYVNNIGALTPDNWLISPAITIGGTSELHYWVACQDPAWPSEHYYVKVSTTDDQVSDFTDTIYDDILVTDAYTEVVISLADYAGQTIFLAWQHADCTDWFYMNLDDISVINAETREITFSADFETEKISRLFKRSNKRENNNRNRDLQGYNIYRSGELSDFTTELTYMDFDLSPGTYVYHVSAVYDEGESSQEGPVEAIIEEVGSNNENISFINDLKSNYPNPFNPETNITFSTKEAGNVTIEIFNSKGQKVKTLANNTFESGIHSIIWNGLDDHNKKVSSGLYLYKMKSSRYNSTKKMVLMK